MVSTNISVPRVRSRCAMSNSGVLRKKSTTMHLAPKNSPVASYQRGFGVWTVRVPCSALSNRHSSSRSLSNTPVSGGGSARSTNDSAVPSAQVTSATALSRL